MGLAIKAWISGVDDKCYVPLLVKDFAEFVENEVCLTTKTTIGLGFR